eukprot:4291262-Prymnesium_polylepis.1
MPPQHVHLGMIILAAARVQDQAARARLDHEPRGQAGGILRVRAASESFCVTRISAHPVAAAEFVVGFAEVEHSAEDVALLRI